MESIISKEKTCFVCGTPYNLHKHHIFGASNRKHSENYGLWVYLCARHHNMSDAGVHFNKELDTELKELAQEKWEEIHGNRAEFRKIFGKSVL